MQFFDLSPLISSALDPFALLVQSLASTLHSVIIQQGHFIHTLYKFGGKHSKLIGSQGFIESNKLEALLLQGSNRISHDLLTPTPLQFDYERNHGLDHISPMQILATYLHVYQHPIKLLLTCICLLYLFL